MQRWVGRVALVTGASSGIGKAIAARFAKHGMKVVASGRKMERLQELAVECQSFPGSIIPMQCNLREEKEILDMFEKIRVELGGVDICVNNAGLINNAPLLSSPTDKWREMLDVHILALCICSREAVKSMRERNVDDGFIINMCSMGGHRMVYRPTSHFYCATKFAVRAISDGLINELRLLKSNIRVLQLSPGLVETEIFERDQGKKASERTFSKFQCLRPDDVVDSVIYGITAPPHVLVTDILIRPTEQSN